MSQLFCQTGELCGKCYSLQLQICHCAWHGLLMTTFISKSHVSLCCWRVDFVIVKYNEMPRRWSEWILPKIQLKWFRSTKKTHAHTNRLFIFFWKHLISRTINMRRAKMLVRIQYIEQHAQTASQSFIWLLGRGRSFGTFFPRRSRNCSYYTHPKDPGYLEWEEDSGYDGIYEPTTFLLLLWNCGRYLRYWIRYLCFSRQALCWLLHRYMLRLQTSQVIFHLPYKMLLPIGVVQIKHHLQLYSNSWEICFVSIKAKPIKTGNTRQGYSIIFVLAEIYSGQMPRNTHVSLLFTDVATLPKRLLSSLVEDVFFSLELAGPYVGKPNLSHVLETSVSPLIQNDRHLPVPVLGLAEMELTSFTAARRVLCFECG